MTTKDKVIRIIVEIIKVSIIAAAILISTYYLSSRPVNSVRTVVYTLDNKVYAVTEEDSLYEKEHYLEIKKVDGSIIRIPWNNISDWK